MLQNYLNLNLLTITDDGHYEKLKKAADTLSKKISKDKNKIVSYTLIVIDPEVSASNEYIIETKEIISKGWNTFVSNTKDTPLTYIRAVILESLKQISQNIEVANLIWLAGKNVICQYKIIGEEKNILSDFFNELGTRIDKETINSWRLVKDIPKEKISEEVKPLSPITIDKSLIEDSLTKATPDGIQSALSKLIKDLNNNIIGSQKAFQTQIVSLTNSLQINLINHYRSLHLRSELLWWKEAAYSDSLKKSYSDISPNILPIFLAIDYNKFIPSLYPRSADYFLKETYKEIAKGKDKKIKVVDFLKEIEQFSGELKEYIPEIKDETSRISFIDFICGIIWNKYKIEQFDNYLGFSSEIEMTISGITFWLFQDFQVVKILNTK